MIILNWVIVAGISKYYQYQLTIKIHNNDNIGSEVRFVNAVTAGGSVKFLPVV